MVLRNLKVGDRVKFRRGAGWLEGEVTHIGQSTAHVKSGDDFLGYETFVENLTILRSTPEPVANKETDNGNE